MLFTGIQLNDLLTRVTIAIYENRRHFRVETQKRD